MVKVHAFYEDGKDVERSHITGISYNTTKTVNIPEEDLVKYLIPIDKTLWLHSNDGITIINSNGLRYIAITQE